MAMMTYLCLKAAGKQIEGESTATTSPYDKMIECLEFEQSLTTATEHGTAFRSGAVTTHPITCTIRIDKSMPLIMKALTQNQTISAEWMLMEPSPADGSPTKYATVSGDAGRISFVAMGHLNVLDPATQHHQATARLGIVFSKFKWEITNGGVSHEHTNNQAGGAAGHG